MAESVSVKITGLREFQKALKDVDADYPKELQADLKNLASAIIGDVQQRMPFRSGEAANSLSPRATQRGAGIAFPGGGTRDGRAPYYPWLDFGGSVGRSRGIHRPVIKGGRYLYPTIADNSEAIERFALDAMETVAKHNGFEVKG